MKSLLKAIKLCGGTNAAFARLITENLVDSTCKPVTTQMVWNWINRDFIVPAEYCPTIEKICGHKIKCEELNKKPDWESIRGTKI